MDKGYLQEEPPDIKRDLENDVSGELEGNGDTENPCSNKTGESLHSLHGSQSSHGGAEEVSNDAVENEVEIGEGINRRIDVLFKTVAEEAGISKTETSGGAEKDKIASSIGKGEVGKDCAENEVGMGEEINRRIAVVYKPVSSEVKNGKTEVEKGELSGQVKLNMMGAKKKLK